MGKLIVAFNGLAVGVLALALMMRPIIEGIAGIMRDMGALGATLEGYDASIARLLTSLLGLWLLWLVFSLLWQGFASASSVGWGGDDGKRFGTAPAVRLPVGDSIRQGGAYAFAHSDAFARFAALPLLAVALLATTVVRLAGLAETAAGAGLTVAVLKLSAILVMVPVVTAILRTSFAGDPQTVPILRYRLGGAEIRFLLLMLSVGLLHVVVIALGMAMGVLIGTLAGSVFFLLAVFAASGVLAAYLSLRFSLVTTAAAVGSKAGFGSSWRATRGHTRQIIAIDLGLALLLLPFAVFLMEIERAAGWLIRAADVSDLPVLTLVPVALALASLLWLVPKLLGIVLGTRARVFAFLTMRETAGGNVILAKRRLVP